MEKKSFRIMLGPSFDFNIVKEPYDKPPYYSPDYPEAAEFENGLEQGYNPVVIYADLQIGFKLNRFNLSANYKYSLTSLTGKFLYEGVQQGVRSNSQQLFVRVGYDIWAID